MVKELVKTYFIIKKTFFFHVRIYWKQQTCYKDLGIYITFNCGHFVSFKVEKGM